MRVYHYTITIEFDESFQSYLSSSVLLMLNTLVLSTLLDVRARFSISDLRLPSDRRTILIGRLPQLAMISSSFGISIFRMNMIFIFTPSRLEMSQGAIKNYAHRILTVAAGHDLRTYKLSTNRLLFHGFYFLSIFAGRYS